MPSEVRVKFAVCPCVTGAVFPQPLVAMGVLTMVPFDVDGVDVGVELALLFMLALRSRMRRIAAMLHLLVCRFFIKLVLPCCILSRCQHAGETCNHELRDHGADS